MEQYVGDFKIQKLLCADAEKESYLAEHKYLKTPYVVQILKGSLHEAPQKHPAPCDNLVTLSEIFFDEKKAYNVCRLSVSEDVMPLQEFILQQDLMEESKLAQILSQFASLLNHYYINQRPKGFGLSLENCFIDKQCHVVIIDQASKSIRSFMNEFNQRSTIEDDSIISFGKIAYFMMTKIWPEGYFPMPSEINMKLDRKWDEFIKSLMHHKPSLRLSSFFDVIHSLDKIKAQPMTLKPILKPAQVERPEFEPNPGHIFQQELVVAKYAPQEKQVVDIQPIMSEMIVIPAGDYERGSLSGARDEMPRHKIQLSPFAIDIHPVTNEQFVRFLEVMGGEKDAQNNDMIRLKESRIKKIGGRLVIESGYSKHPVVGISWYGASAYAKWVGKRLPTEAEWEIAASSLKGSTYPTGETIEKSMANFFASDTTVIMSYPPTELGLYDVAGNVYEWCHDWYGYNYYEASIQEPLNPQGPQQGVYRVLRGGCWKSLKEDLRVSHRHRNNPFASNSTYGFRCAADVE
jgi:formylglycine-generating enzyme required for sulfatase activity